MKNNPDNAGLIVKKTERSQLFGLGSSVVKSAEGFSSISEFTTPFFSALTSSFIPDEGKPTFAGVTPHLY